MAPDTSSVRYLFGAGGSGSSALLLMVQDFCPSSSTNRRNDVAAKPTLLSFDLVLLKLNLDLLRT
ncbi:hypothetical protein PAAG_11236 [Paracoccidioides lutzii Pb01]|uniref:Uncharacterized protein n=1 Tax=Paracoccidioides lutzii (strain ATCC MYA-826 / Pb01) TaxID=502779 RepID=A0A0A2V7I5_PARBA|nr:hypothetical protein PAAG_11236 [Paracoccidioides lutzii Pb01]KGQ02055.1 hypothetical protein PAAG_11236 [Paracoccidioides lutzii Pb01]